MKCTLHAHLRDTVTHQVLRLRQAAVVTGMRNVVASHFSHRQEHRIVETCPITYSLIKNDHLAVVQTSSQQIEENCV